MSAKNLCEHYKGFDICFEGWNDTHHFKDGVCRYPLMLIIKKNNVWQGVNIFDDWGWLILSEAKTEIDKYLENPQGEILTGMEE